MKQDTTMCFAWYITHVVIVLHDRICKHYNIRFSNIKNVYGFTHFTWDLNKLVFYKIIDWQLNPQKSTKAGETWLINEINNKK